MSTRTLTEEQLPAAIRGLPEPKRKAWLNAYNERFTPVQTCAVCSKEMIAEEVRAHQISHLSPKARRVVGMLERVTEDVRQEVMTYLSERQ